MEKSGLKFHKKNRAEVNELQRNEMGTNNMDISIHTSRKSPGCSIKPILVCGYQDWDISSQLQMKPEATKLMASG